MHPVLFTLGGIEARSYGFMGAVGFVVACVIALRRTRAAGYPPERTADVIFWTAIAALAASRAMFVLQEPEAFSSWREWFNLRTGGLVFYGALLPGLAVAAGLIRRYRLPFFLMMDIFATALPLAHGLSRIGCFLAGCCYGAATTVPWATVYTDPLSSAPLGIPLHPTQLYEAAYLFAIGAFVNWLYPRRRWDGQVMLTYLVSYAACRAVNELFRGDADRGWFLEPVLGHLLWMSQGLSLLLAAAAFAVFFVVARRSQGTTSTGDQPRPAR